MVGGVESQRDAVMAFMRVNDAERCPFDWSFWLEAPGREKRPSIPRPEDLGDNLGQECLSEKSPPPQTETTGIRCSK